MKQLLAAASVCALLAAAPAWAQNAGAQGAAGPNTAQPGSQGVQSLSQQDRTFVKEASAGNLAEAELGKLAMRKGATSGVKTFGRWMYTDHGLVAAGWLKEILATQGETMQPTLTAEQQQMKQKLEGLNGRQFDEQYIQNQISDHEKDIPKFQTEARDGQNTMIKNFAQQMVPVLQQHLEGVRALSGRAGVAAGEGAAAAERSGSTMPSR